MGTEGPVQEEYEEMMRVLGGVIDHLLNGDRLPKQTGFAILMFDFNETPTSDRINYLSNARRAEMIIAMKELVARFEGRHIEETQTPLPTEPM